MDPRLESLEQLGRLRDLKVLSEAEFDTEKARLLALGEAPPPQSAPLAFAAGLNKLKHRKVWVPLAVGAALMFGTYFGLSSVVPVNRDPAAAKAEPVQAASPSGQPASLSAILKFEKPEECVPGAELNALFADLRALEPGATRTVTAGLNGPAFKPDVLRAEQNNAVIARIMVPGILEGLRVTELRTTRFDGSDTQVLQIRFAESPELVRTKLNSSGFALAKPDEVKTVELDEGRGLVYGIAQADNGTALTCASL